MAYDKVTYNSEYNRKNYDRIELKVPKGKKAEWQAKAKAAGVSLTEYITDKMEGNMKTYYIADDAGSIYAHDIKGKDKADALMNDIINQYKERSEDVPEGIEVLEDE